jgi:hypothetical protein
MNITTYPLDYYIARLKTADPFCFVRYGDGEFEAMGILPSKTGQNCDGHKYFTDMGDELRETIKTHDGHFTRAIGHMATRDNGRQLITDYLIENDCDLNWHDTETFLEASLKGQLNPLVRYIRNQKTLYLCPDSLKMFVYNNLRIDHTITIPKTNAYLEINKIEKATIRLINKTKPTLLLISGGPMAKVLLYRLFVKHNIRINMLDMGSIWDGYVGRHSRSHTRKLTKQFKAHNLR